MRCDGFERWLDEGLPADAEAEALAHARDCAPCAASLAAARAVEASLRAAPPAAPAGFTAAVMARVAGGERRFPAPARPAAPAAPWWLVIGSEPALWVGAGLAAIAVAARTAIPGLGEVLTGAGSALSSAWAGTASAWGVRLASVLVPLDATQRAALALVFALPVLWFLYRAPIWLADAWTSSTRAAARARASRPRSSR